MHSVAKSGRVTRVAATETKKEVRARSDISVRDLYGIMQWTVGFNIDDRGINLSNILLLELRSLNLNFCSRMVEE